MQFWRLCMLPCDHGTVLPNGQSMKDSCCLTPSHPAAGSLGEKGEHVCLRNREQPVFTFFRAEWSLSWPPPKFISHFATHELCFVKNSYFHIRALRSQNPSTLCQSDAGGVGFILYLVITSQVFMSCFSWTPVPVVCQHTHFMYTNQAVVDK